MNNPVHIWHHGLLARWWAEFNTGGDDTSPSGTGRPCCSWTITCLAGSWRKGWGDWVEPPELPRPWPSLRDRRTARDGSELELGIRQSDFDPLEQTMALEMAVRHLVGGVEAWAETGSVEINIYFQREIGLMLKVAGFAEVRVTGFPEDRPALPWRDQRIVFHARA